MSWRIYVAGPISNTDPCVVLKNIGEGIQASRELIKHGYVPFCPFADFLYFFSEPRPSLEKIQIVSIEWMKKCHAILMLPGWEKSRGSLREKLIAEKKGIPIFYSIHDLLMAMPPDKKKGVKRGKK